MKKWVVVIVILIAVGVYFYWKSLNSKSESVAGQPPGNNEMTLEQKLQYATTNLRSIHTALESWKIDHKSYPDNLFVLTTPIAYMTRIPKDPFTQNEVFRYKKISDEDFLLWSVGPDGKDDGGQILFNQNNGVTSSGDIVRAPSIN